MNVPDKLISLCSWEEICIYIFAKKSKALPSVRVISKELNIPQTNVYRHLKKLQNLGFIGTPSGTAVGTPSGTAKTLKDSMVIDGHGTPSGTAVGTPSGTAKVSSIDERKNAFEHSLASYVTSGQYDAKMVRAFSDYWTEYNKTKTKMRWEYEKTWETSKRLSTWASRNKQKFQSEKNNTDIGVILHDSKNKDYKKGAW